MLDDQGTAALNLAHIAYERNELEPAEEFAQQALHFAQERANEMLEVQATVRLAISSVLNDIEPERSSTRNMESALLDSVALSAVVLALMVALSLTRRRVRGLSGIS